MPLPALTYRRDLSAPLSADEFDGNTENFDTRITALEDDPPTAISVSGAHADGNQLVLELSDASTLPPITLPVAQENDRTIWEPSTDYVVNDTFGENGTFYRVIRDHTSGLTFDAGANDGLGHSYYKARFSAPSNALPDGGLRHQKLRKKTDTSYDQEWGWDDAVEVTFEPSSSSALVSDNVGDALEELEALVASAVAAVSFDATEITFDPSSASGLTSTTVADALDEIATGYLPLAGGTLSGTLTLASDPASALQAVTKQYADGLALNLGKRARVRALDSTDSDPATSGYTNGATIDGVTLATGDQVLRSASGHQARNGVWVVVASGGAARADQFDSYNEHPGSLIAVEEGTTNADTLWICTSNVGGTLNTTAIVFSAAGTGTSYSAGTGLTLTSTTFSIDGAIVGRLATANTWALAQTFTAAPVFTDASGTRTALGLGTAATHAATDFQTADVQLFSTIPQNSKSAAYTTILTDGEKHIFHPSADTTARTFTIDSNANVAYPIGTVITFVNQHSAGVVTIAITTDTMRLAGAGTTGSRTLAADGIATALKIATTEWIISGTGLT